MSQPAMKGQKLHYLMALPGHALRSIASMYLHPFSSSWDDRLQRILNEGELVVVSNYVATFFHNNDIVCVWIANRWFAFGDLYSLNGVTTPLHHCARPRFRTMYRLHQIIQAHQRGTA